jgi:hypothetical protein
MIILGSELWYSKFVNNLGTKYQESRVSVRFFFEASITSKIDSKIIWCRTDLFYMFSGIYFYDPH